VLPLAFELPFMPATPPPTPFPFPFSPTFPFIFMELGSVFTEEANNEEIANGLLLGCCCGF